MSTTNETTNETREIDAVDMAQFTAQVADNWHDYVRRFDDSLDWWLVITE